MIATAVDESIRVKSVTLDGADVTSSCFYADDEAGIVEVYEMDESGHIIAVNSDGDTIRHKKHGEVIIALDDSAR